MQKNPEYVIKSDLKDKMLYCHNEFVHDCRGNWGNEHVKYKGTGMARGIFHYTGFMLWHKLRSAEVIDLWSDDTKQDTWFTQSALDIGFSWLESSFPGFRVYFFSGE